MDFKKYLDQKKLNESIPNTMLKAALRNSNVKLDNDIDSKVLECYKKTFGGLNKTVRYPLYIDQQYYNSYDFENELYTTCIQFSEILFETGKYNSDGEFIKEDTFVNSVGVFFTNFILAFNNKLKEPAVISIRDGDYSVENSSNGVTTIKSFDVSHVVTIKKERAEIDKDFEKFLSYLSDLISNNCKIVVNYEKMFDNANAVAYNLNYSIVFKTRPKKIDYFTIAEFSLSKESAKKQCILIDNREYNIAKMYLSLIDILTRSCLDIYNHIQKEYNTPAFNIYVKQLILKVNSMRKISLNNKIDHLIKHYKDSLLNYANTEDNADKIHLYDLIITTSIRHNIAMSMDKSWVSCQTWTKDDLKSAFFSDLVSTLRKQINVDSDVGSIKSILTKLISRKYMDRYYQIIDIDKLSDQIFKYAKNNQNLNFRTIEFNEILQKQLTICVNTSTHSANLSSASPNKSAVAWKYIATAYIVNKDQNIDKHVLKRITIIPFGVFKNNNLKHVYYSPLPELHKHDSGSYKNYWNNFSIYSKYQKENFNFDIVMDECSKIFKKYALLNGAIPEGNIKALGDGIIYTQDVQAPEIPDLDPDNLPF